jgi:hypothetical protein|tara:strand:- start:8400 stop:8852 length:453 start_codon:yes stop_codon:yes gene_type:complete
MVKTPTYDDKVRLAKFVTVCVVLILTAGVIAYHFNENKNVLSFLGVYPFPTLLSIFTGMAANIVFGMIDNGGLFFGMDALTPFLPEGELTRAGIGNTVSDGLGAFLGTFSGIIIKSITKIDDTPIWSDAIGIVIGCLIGLYVPKYITGKK